MRVIHGVWARGALCLWAEDPDLPAAPAGPVPPPAPHPFACQAAELADVLAALDLLAAAGALGAVGGADVQRAHDLAAAMPDSCRAVAGKAPGALLAAALDGLTDAAARTRLPGSLLPARRGRTPARIPLAERYVAALTSTDARLAVVTPRDEADAADWVRKARLGLKLTTRSRASSGSAVARARFGLGESHTMDTRTDIWTVRRPNSRLDPSLPCVSIPSQGCLACW